MKRTPLDLTTLINRWFDGDREVEQELWSALERELRTVLASVLWRFRRHHTLEPADLLGELYLKLDHRTGLHFATRAHFFAYASDVLRSFLIDYERTHRRRPQGRDRTTISTSIPGVTGERSISASVVDDLLQRLAGRSPRAARIVHLRVFGGLTQEEVSKVGGWSLSTIKRDETAAHAWLRRQFAEGGHCD